MMKEEAEINHFCSLMESPDCDSWLKARQIIQRKLRDAALLPSAFSRQIAKNIEKIKNILMLVYVYSLNLGSSYITQEYYKAFGDIKKTPSNYEVYCKILDWISTQNSEVKQATIQLLLQNYCSLLNKKINHIHRVEINFCVQVFSLFEIRRERDMVTVINFLTAFQQTEITRQDQYYTKGSVVIREVCQILRDPKKDQGNMGIILDEAVLGYIDHKVIEKFCNFQSEFICMRSAEQLLNMLDGFCKASLNYFIVRLINGISQVLASQEQFYKLKHLYEKFILPQLVRRGKHCRIERVSQQICFIGQFYVRGFLSYCDIGSAGIECLLENIENVSEQKQKKAWIILALQAQNKSKLTGSVYKILQSKKIPLQLIRDCLSELESIPLKDSWEITVRNIRELKVYKREDSNLKGLKNLQSQCYIISTIQALFRSSGLYQLFHKLPKIKKQTIIAELNQIFTYLSEEKTDKSDIITVVELKLYGPTLFAQSRNQEDVHQYLLALMDQIEIELKKEKQQLLKQFKQIYEIEERAKVHCNSCSYVKDTIQKTYIHTVSHSEKIKLQSSEKLTDFSCEKCTKKNVTKTTRIFLNCEVFIVHINRFSMLKGLPRKQLPTEKIPRRIQDFELVGIIFHIGKQVASGHYVYYWRRDRKRWVLFNDIYVSEFELQNQNEQFQRELKAEMTPYILFYNKCK